MAGGHSHTHDPARQGSESGADSVRVGALARGCLIAFLTLAGAATIFGLVRFWPGEVAPGQTVGTTDFAAPGVTFPIATVSKVLPACEDDLEAPPTEGQSGDVALDTTCGALVVTLEPATGSTTNDRPAVSVSVPPAVTGSGLQPGDQVQLLKIPARDGNPESYSFLQVQRGAPLTLMFVLFVVAVALVARWRGLLALVGLGFGGLIVVSFMLPALLEGESGLVVALIGSSAIMFVVLYLAHGLSIRTSTALAGTLFGVGITAVLGLLAVDMARLSGVADDEGATLASFVQTMSPQELLTCAIIVAGLGVLNDVTITQSSAVWELRAAAPTMGRRELFTSGMRIGRDHIASTIYTIVFAYAGAALPVLLLLFLYERPVLDLLQTESLAEEIVRTLASAIGLVLAVPATTAIAALTIGGAAKSPAPEPGVAAADGSAGLPTTRGPREAVTGQRPPETRAEVRARERRSGG